MHGRGENVKDTAIVRQQTGCSHFCRSAEHEGNDKWLLPRQRTAIGQIGRYEKVRGASDGDEQEGDT